MRVPLIHQQEDEYSWFVRLVVTSYGRRYPLLIRMPMALATDSPHPLEANAATIIASIGGQQHYTRYLLCT